MVDIHPKLIEKAAEAIDWEKHEYRMSANWVPQCACGWFGETSHDVAAYDRHLATIALNAVADDLRATAWVKGYQAANDEWACLTNGHAGTEEARCVTDVSTSVSTPTGRTTPMPDNPVVGYITGTLSLTLRGGEPVDIGTVKLPLVPTRVSAENSSITMSYGIGVDLGEVRRTIESIFKEHEEGSTHV